MSCSQQRPGTAIYKSGVNIEPRSLGSSHTALLSGEHESSRGQLFVFVTVFTDVVPTLLIRLQLGVFGKVVLQVVSTLISSVSRIPHATTMNARIRIV